MSVIRQFEYIEGTSRKFWNVQVQGSNLLTQWVRIGHAGQCKTKRFASQMAADFAMLQLVRSKLRKGYREMSRPARQHSPATGCSSRGCCCSASSSGRNHRTSCASRTFPPSPSVVRRPTTLSDLLLKEIQMMNRHRPSNRVFDDFDRRFDEQFNRIQNTHKTVMRVAPVTILVLLLLKLAFVAGLIYVAIHFLSKFW